jgi:ribosomal protein S18 acetylase RimI-like enzyme
LKKKSHIIKPLPESRWQDCKALRLEALHKEPLAFGSSYEEEKNLTESDWRERIHNALFAQVANEPVGLVVLIIGSNPNEAHVANLFSFYVKPSFRGQGIGDQLLTKALEKLRAMDQMKKVRLAVNVEQRSAIRLYERFGFKKIDILNREIFHQGQYYDELIMELVL